MEPVHLALLESIGFEWTIRKPIEVRHTPVYDQKFVTMVEKLKQFKHENGHCGVPQKYNMDQPLANFVKNCRGAKTNGTLTKEREAALDEIGFIW
jgi:hypothetical protein